MKKAKLPFPVLILISTTVFLFSSTFGEWIARPAPALRAPAREATEQQTAFIYVRAMSWLSQLISHPTAHSEADIDSAHTAEPPHASTREIAGHSVQLCALTRPSHPSRIVCKSLPRQLSIQSFPRLRARLYNVQSTTDN